MRVRFLTLRAGHGAFIALVMNAATYYVHTIDPVLVHVWGPIAVRWYGLSYVAGFLAGYLLLRHWAKKGWFRIGVEDVQSLIFFAVIGVMIGGRLGYVLLYDFLQWREEFWLPFQVWRGGMSSHGGMIGLAVAVYGFARARRVPFLHVADALVCAGPIGLFFGRLANFINGELWGRVATVRWAVIFPQEAGLFPPQPGLREQALRLYASGALQPRHPAQLYAALIEGLLLFGVMLTLRRTRWAAQADGRLLAVSIFVYAAGRIAVEIFREPEIVHMGWLTQGQLLSLLMMVPAAWLLKVTLRSSSDRRT